MVMKMKTRDAFALRDFDDKRILQRPFFSKLRADFHFADNASDDEILDATFGEAAIKYLGVSATETELEKLRKLQSDAERYRKRIKKHVTRLKKFLDSRARKFTTTGLEKYKNQYEQCAGLLLQYNWFEEATEIFNLKIGGLCFESERILDSLWRNEFGRQLKLARVAKGLRQQDVANKLRIPTSTFASYEQGRNDPSLPTLIRISKLLDLNLNKLLLKAS